MKVEEKGHTIIIRDTQRDCNAFLMKITHEHKTFRNHNLVLDLSSSDLTQKNLSQFKPLSKIHKSAKKSFIIVESGIDYNAVPDALLVVPTILEAQDLIEMEEIERDLGF
jgi:hypothetical protein